MIAVDRISVLPGHNARRQVGDVEGLAASIRTNGVLQALTVVELEPEVYGLVAGERRLTASRQVGLGQVPCLVRDLDERGRTVAMLVENLQRQDLQPLEEAEGLRRLAGMGLSQRVIAAELGCSQSHVSKRLALLDLSEQVREAIGRPADSGGITVAEALELTRLQEHPERLAEAFERGSHGAYGGVTGQVRGHLEDLRREQTVADARARLAADGVHVLEEEPPHSWWGRHERPLRGCGHDHEAIPLTVEQHRAEPCHAAAVERHGTVVHVCRDPARHGLAADRQATSAREKGQQLEQVRLGQQAAARRREAITTALAAANTGHLPFAARQVLEGARVDESRLACQLLGIEPADGPHGRSHTAALGEYAGRGMGPAIRAVLALALAAGEQIVSSPVGGPTERGRRHLELLAAAGYQPGEADRHHLDGAR